jgi:hypothetical protein
MTVFTEAEVVIRRSAADGINDAANDLAGRSMGQAPVDTGELRASAAYPAVDPRSRATPVTLLATVSFNKVYAHAQHAGEIVYPLAVTYHVREHERRKPKGGVTMVRSHAAVIGPGVVELRVHPRGGKDHYLSDPLKAMTPRYEAYVGAKVKVALELWARGR